MSKIFVLDTNVILSDPRSIFQFEENDIILPLVVIEEVDKFKKDMAQIGLAARTFSRYIDSLRERGSLMEGVALKEGGTIKIDVTPVGDLKHLGVISSQADDVILACAINVHKANPDKKVILVSKDINMRIKADAHGITSETYTNETVNYAKLPKGYIEKTVSTEIIDKIFQEKKVTIDNFPELEKEAFANCFFTLTDEANERHKIVVKFDPFTKTIAPMKQFRDIWGLTARNPGQKMAFDLLMDDRINLVSLVGIAGTGKTLIAIATALEKCLNEGLYTKILVARPIYPMGKDIGFLPGTIEEKLKPWMQPVFDNLEYLLTGYDSPNFGKMADLLNSQMIEIEALTYIRGRSIPNQFIIIDEAQNLTPHEMKTIISRAGENSKIVLTGDPFQIDNPYMNESSNGLSYVVDRFKELDLAGHMILEKGERSPLADAAAKLL